MSLKSYKAYSDSEYLRKEDFPEPETLTIAEVREEEVQAPGKEPKLKVILYFEERQKGLVLNLANGAVLELITKSDLPDKWIGVRVRVYHDPTVEFGGKRVGGIRLAPVRKLTQRKPVVAKPVLNEPVKPAPTNEMVDATGSNLVEAAAKGTVEIETDEDGVPY